MAYEMVMPYHLHMPSYFLETFTEYPSILPYFAFCEKIKNPDSGNQDFTVFFSSRWCHQQPKIGLYSTVSQ